MAAKILQVNFKLNAPVSDYQQMCQSLADTFASIPGLNWKVWILNEQEREAGGIYLFQSQDALNDFLSGPVAAQVKTHPGLRDVSLKTFDVMEGVTAVTRGPILAAAMAR